MESRNGILTKNWQIYCPHREFLVFARCRCYCYRSVLLFNVQLSTQSDKHWSCEMLGILTLKNAPPGEIVCKHVGENRSQRKTFSLQFFTSPPPPDWPLISDIYSPSDLKGPGKYYTTIFPRNNSRRCNSRSPSGDTSPPPPPLELNCLWSPGQATRCHFPASNAPPPPPGNSLKSATG